MGSAGGKAADEGSGNDRAALTRPLRQLLVGTPPSPELEGLTAAELDRLAERALDILSTPPLPGHQVHVGAGEGDIGRRHMPVILHSRDLPFLLESASAALSARHLAIHRVLRRSISVLRHGDGSLRAFADEAAPTDAATTELLIFLDVDRAPARQRAGLVTELAAVVADIEHATSDWPAMRLLAEEARNRLSASDSANDPRSGAGSEDASFLQWLLDGNFVFLGARDGSRALGILRDAARLPLPPAGAASHGLVISRSRAQATVRRRAAMTVIGLPGRGRQLVGLLTRTAQRESPDRVPILRRRIDTVAAALHVAPQSHERNALIRAIDTLPREELLEIDDGELQALATGLLSLLERPRPDLFIRHDPGRQSATLFVYLPYDLYSGRLKQRLDRMLDEQSGGVVSGFDMVLRSDGLARLSYAIDGLPAAPDRPALKDKLLELARDWGSRLESELSRRMAPLRASRLALRFADSFPRHYRIDTDPEDAVADVQMLNELERHGGLSVRLTRSGDDPERLLRLTLMHSGRPMPLSKTVPILENFGFRVLEERSYPLAARRPSYLHTLLLDEDGAPDDLAAFRATVEPAIEGVLAGRLENDPLNVLVPALSIGAGETSWIRAWFRYLRQTGVSYSIQTVAHALRQNGEATTALLALFRARHSAAGSESTAKEADARFCQALDQVASIDDDRILRLFADVVRAVVRSNAFPAPATGAPEAPEALAFKLDSSRIPHLPKPVPWREIWVYSPRVEGIHLRAGPIARGGIRWSDRRDDFRTEVLDLVRTQTVKNAVIVPTGAKGGFYPKQLPDPASDRDGWAAEGTAAYKIFIRALLSLTDNLDSSGAIVPPAGIVRLDGDDPYLVVAADKGTARFSDTANSLSKAAGFWLDDAFASGGSAGYDHKGMGITARGAWISVTRHFAELGVDVQSDPITVAGVGDMSGDVFGNGMLQSKALRLVAAFDHRHIFLDPAPDPEASHRERARLYALPRSSWGDYDPAKISTGGGVYPRTQKRIPLSAEVRALLHIDADSLAPADLVRAILKAPVDLLWFGGIGTFVKASTESDEAVGDNGNRLLRINGAEVGARVIGEGANLGCTQAGRIEYALKGGHLNADFIDNSAGVDTSDHEVNLKIALQPAVAAGRLDLAGRNRLLAGMRDEVAALVLNDNREQTLALSIAESDAPAMLDTHVELIRTLEESGRLDADVEGLPSLSQLAERKRLGKGLTRPELAILLSYVKMELRDAIAASKLAGDPLTGEDLLHEFPHSMHESFRAEIEQHRLRPRIVSTMLANRMVNRGGLSLSHQLASENGRPLSTVAAAFVTARTLFNLDGLWGTIDAASLPGAGAPRLHAEAARVTSALVGDLVPFSGDEQPLLLATRLAPGLARILKQLDHLLRPEPRARIDALRRRLTALGAPDAVIDWLATLHTLSGAAGILALAVERSLDEAETADAYTALGDALALDWAEGATRALSGSDPWERLFAATTARSFAAMRLSCIRRETPPGGSPRAAIDSWLAAQTEGVSRLRATIAAARAHGNPSLAMLAQLAAEGRQLLSA